MNFEGFFAHTAVLQALSLAWKLNCYFSDRYICTAISNVLRGICRKSLSTLSVQLQSPSLKTLVLCVWVFCYYFKIVSEAIWRDLIYLKLLVLRYLRKSSFRSPLLELNIIKSEIN